MMELINLMNYVPIFLSQKTLLRWWIFLLESLNAFFFIYFVFLKLVFVLQWLFLQWEIQFRCFSFHRLCSNLKVAASFHCTLYGYSCADWDDFLEHLRDVSWEDILSNCLPIECFLLTYDLKSCKSRVNRHLLSLGSFQAVFLVWS